MADPLTLMALSNAAPSVGQSISGIGQAGFGLIQARRAKEAIQQLQQNAPTLEVPAALRQLAGEPIAEDYINAQELGAQRRTAQSVDALSKGGSRALVGALPQVLESERIGEQQRAGQYEQARLNAMGNLANAEQSVMQTRLRQYFEDLNAARGSLDAGIQNTFNGLSSVLGGGSQAASSIQPQNSSSGQSIDFDYLNERFSGLQGSNNVQNMTPRPTPTSFEKGGMIKTKGAFSHRKNPKYLVDGNSGEVEAELTGGEVVFNPEDSDKMEDMANKGQAKKLAKFVKGRYKKFNSKRK